MSSDPLLPVLASGAIAFALLMSCTSRETPEAKQRQAERVEAQVAEEDRKAAELFKKNGFEIVGKMTGDSSAHKYCYTLKKPANGAFTYTGCFDGEKITDLSAIEAKAAPGVKL